MTPPAAGRKTDPVTADRREPPPRRPLTLRDVAEAARVLSTYVDAIAIRAFPKFQDWRKEREDPVLSGFVRHANVPIVNMETIVHPCQELAMLLALQERHGDLSGKKMCLTWTYHPKPLNTAVMNSALLAATKMGMEVTLLCPSEPYLLDEKFIKAGERFASENGRSLSITHDVEEAYRGADAVYAAGGAQAVAALAYGTETVTSAEKVVGPGNRFVTAAKAEVRGDVDIDFLAGPSEILVLADGTAEPRFVAADVVAQAEHDADASVVVVTDDADLAAAVCEEVERQAGEREREETIREALASDASGVFLARSMSEAVLFAEEYAAEHLSIQADDDEALLERVTNAGSVFLGPSTNGGARRFGGLSVDTFLRSTTVQRLSRDGLDDLRDAVETLARAEGLEAHAESVVERFREE